MRDDRMLTLRVAGACHGQAPTSRPALQKVLAMAGITNPLGALRRVARVRRAEITVLGTAQEYDPAETRGRAAPQGKAAALPSCRLAQTRLGTGLRLRQS